MSDAAQPSTQPQASTPTPSTAPPLPPTPAAAPKGSQQAAAGAKPGASSLLAPRHIPGAPPPEPPKEKKKRNKKKKGANAVDSPSDAALLETAPTPGSVAQELVATQQEIQEEVVEEEPEEELPRWKVFKKSAAVDVIGNKIKKLQTKLENAKKPVKNESALAKLGYDQKPLSETPAFIEAEIEEFKELKVAVEEEEVKRREKEEATLKEHRLADRKEQRALLKEQMAATKAEALHKVDFMLSFIALSTLLSSSAPSRPFTVPISDAERATISKAMLMLLEEETKAEVIGGLLDENNAGDLDGTPYARLRALTKSFSQPLSSFPSPLPGSASEPRRPLQPYTNGLQTFNFTNESELDVTEVAPHHIAPIPLTFGTSSALEDVHGIPVGADGSVEIIPGESSLLDSTAELVDGTEAVPSATTVQQEWVEVEAAAKSLPTPEIQETPATAGPTNDTFDWAADDLDHEDLPPLDSLHAKFGTSGNVTPTTTSVSQAAPTPPVVEPPQPIEQPLQELPPPTPKAPKAEDDGEWITPRQPKPQRGGMGGGFGGPRGRGDFRGGPRGDFNNRGGQRGGGSGFRGGQQRGGGSGFRPRDGEDGGSGDGWRGRGGSGFRGNGGQQRGGGDWRDGGDRPRGRGNFRGAPPYRPPGQVQSPA